ncbi:MAG: ABC-2 transporter permease [Oscillospiraceae bacterium]|jgi:hypothetical protein|nr:ABC-2 transporter permease [Oscillospiraceae bacterium]
MKNKMMALDWRTVKSYWYSILLVFPLMIVFSSAFSLALVPLSVYFVMSFILNTFALEERNSLGKLYLTLPVRRRDIVAGRFRLSFLLIGAGITAGALLMLLTSMFSQSNAIDFRLDFAVFGLSASVLYSALLHVLTFPTLFWLGFQKGRLLGMVLPIIVCFGGLTYIMNSLGDYAAELLNANLWFLSVACAAAALILFTLSYVLSAKAYERREF